MTTHSRLSFRTFCSLAAILICLCSWKSFSAPLQDAAIFARVIDAGAGLTMPCTVTIRTSSNSIVTENPDFMGGFRSSGRFEKAVPAGRTSVTVSRGFDYVAERRELTLLPGQRVHLTFRLQRQADLRKLGWYCGDSHVHMIHGERKYLVSFADAALAGRAAGLDYMSIAQNWNLPPGQVTPARLASICKRLSTPHFIFMWNMEEPKNYWRGDVTHCLGHCWELGMRGYTPRGRNAIHELLQMSEHDYESAKTPAPNFESQALIHSLGGIVVYTHPCRWWWGDWGGKGEYPAEEGKFISNLAQELPFDTVAGPTYDAIDILMQSWDQEDDRAAQLLWFMLLNKGYRMPATASTDASFDSPGSALPGAARVYTHVHGAPSISAIASAMKAGRNFVTTGPLLLLKIEGHQPGDVIRVLQPSQFQVNIRAWPSGMGGERLTRVELLRNGEVEKEFPLNSKDEFNVTFNIRETGTAWYIARCFGSNDLQTAITNPIYFEGADYKPPKPVQAHVTGVVTSPATGKRLNGEVEVIRMIGLTPSVLSAQKFEDNRFTLDAPATARLRIVVPGYKPVMKSVFMDFKPLLRMTLNMREAEITDWRTFEEFRHLLSNVKLTFHLQPLSAKSTN
ncbi:MAG: carboxypeptidase regulatory-like domain-containing protein [Acidobacteriota bacterium]|nr:carboxypeptidase regulatory-like domain-containing protein [Acidobacteriota bacterium]